MSADTNLGRFVIAAPAKHACAASHEPVLLFISNRPQDHVGFLGLWLARCIAAPIHVATPEHAAQGISPGWAPISSSAPGNSKRSVVPRRPRGRC